MGRGKIGLSLVYFIISTSLQVSLAWNIEELAGFIDKFKQCTVAVQLYGSDFSFPQVSIPLTLFRGKAHDLMPSLSKTRVMHSSTCVTFIHILRPELSFTTLLVKTIQQRRNHFAYHLNAYFRHKFVIPSDYFLIVCNYQQLEVVMRNRDMSLARVFTVYLKRNSNELNLQFGKAWYLCPFCVYSHQRIHINNLYSMTKKPINLNAANFDQDNFRGSAFFLQSEAFVRWWHFKHHQYCNTYLLKHFLRQFHCTVLAAKNRIHQAVIVVTLFRAMKYNHTKTLEEDKLVASQLHPHLHYGQANLRYSYGAEKYTHSSVQFMVSSRRFNFVTCFGSYHSIKFRFYLDPLDLMTWISIVTLSIFLGVTATISFKTTISEGVYFVLCLTGTLLEQSIQFAHARGQRKYQSLLLLWIVMGITLTGSYKGIIVSDLITPSVESNPLPSFWNLTGFDLYTPGNTFRPKSSNDPYTPVLNDNSCTREMYTETDFYKAIHSELNEYEKPIYNRQQLSIMSTMASRLHRCPDNNYKAVIAFQNLAGLECRLRRIAFVHSPLQLELARRMLNRGLHGEPYKIWTQPVFEDILSWHTQYSAGMYLRKNLHQLINTGVDNFWRNMQVFIDTRNFLSTVHAWDTSFNAVTLHGNVATIFYVLIALTAGITVLVFIPECLVGVVYVYFYSIHT